MVINKDEINLFLCIRSQTFRKRGRILAPNLEGEIMKDVSYGTMCLVYRDLSFSS